ncbi:hypothetical protein [Vitreimonas sp.]|jgi:hypothetical protein|uniref:hypothetical protein n=1 Tax=Vitreimonas sp. TaxID=3069702 RepID=UPI002EDAD91E
MREYKQHIPETPRDVMAQLGFMVLKAPTFEDSFFIGRNVDTVFLALNGGLSNIRRGLGEDLYAALVSLSDQVRAHFEADPTDSNGRTSEGRKLLYEMRHMLEQRWPYLAPSHEDD